MVRKVPGRGVSERSKKTRKLSVAFPNHHLDRVEQEAKRRGVAAAEVVREAVSDWVKANERGGMV